MPPTSTTRGVLTCVEATRFASRRPGLRQALLQKLGQREHRIEVRRGRGGHPTQLDHGAEQRVGLERASRLHILQHGGLVVTDPFRTCDALLDGYSERDTELAGNR